MQRPKTNWKITVTPNKNGICVSTVSNVNDVLAETLSKVVEQSLLKFAIGSAPRG